MFSHLTLFSEVLVGIFAEQNQAKNLANINVVLTFNLKFNEILGCLITPCTEHQQTLNQMFGNMLEPGLLGTRPAFL